MSGEDLLAQLGRLARAEEQESPPRELLTPSASAQAKAVGRALEGLGIPRHEVGRPQRRRRFLFAAAVPLAAACAALLWIRRPHELPLYQLELAGGVSELRGSPAQGPLLLEAGARVEVRLRPAVEVDGAVAVQFYWAKEGRAQRWSVNAEAAPGGALRVRAAATSPFGPGDGKLIVLVGRPDQLPDHEITDEATLVGHAEARVLTWSVRWK